MKKILLPALLVAVMPVVANGLEIKGLTLGHVYDAQMLAEIFGNAQCPSGPDTTDSLAFKFDLLTCYVPISYLGLKTKAEVNLSATWMVKSIKIDIPHARIDEIERLLIDKYGNPKLKRGELEKMVPALNPNDPQEPLYARCTTWPDVQAGQIRLCSKRLILAGGPYVEYSISSSSALDPRDM